MLFEAVHFAVAVAGETGGAFDPTVHSDATFRDVVMDAAARTIALRRPLLLDLGAVAKGLAVDAAARELKPFANFAIDAGGDLYLGGRNARGEPWTVGIRHPRVDGALIDSVRVSDAAVCTSGDYERGAHILDPASGMPAHGVISVTAIAPNALLADAAATAAFVLGPERGLDFLERQGVEGLVVTADLDCRATPGFPRA
jgi:thiamine biosynthesis lipoprotein